jgi:hypothetical protein
MGGALRESDEATTTFEFRSCSGIEDVTIDKESHGTTRGEEEAPFLPSTLIESSEVVFHDDEILFRMQKRMFRCSNTVATFSGLGFCFVLVLLLLSSSYQQFIWQEDDRSARMKDEKVVLEQNHSTQQPAVVSKYSIRANYKNQTLPSRQPYAYPEDLQRLPDVVWLMSFPGSTGVSDILQSVERMTQAATATNYGALLFDSAVPVNPDYQCGPYIRAPQLPLPKQPSYILTNTYCIPDVVQTSTVCVECPVEEHDLLAFERACATGNIVYEQQLRAVQYDSELPERFVHFIQDPFATVVNRLQITLQQKLADDHAHSKPSFFNKYTAPSSLSESLSILDYCAYLDSVYDELKTDSTLENYTHVPCHTEFFRYIQWHNDATNLQGKYADTKPARYLWYENLTSVVGLEPLLEFLNFKTIKRSAAAASTPQPSVSEFFSERIMRDASRMIKEFASPMAWELIRHYLDPYLQRGKYHHFHGKKKHNTVFSKMPLSSLLDATAKSDDDIIIDDTLGYRQQDPFYGAELPPQEPDDANPQVVWLLSFPNSVCLSSLLDG